MSARRPPLMRKRPTTQVDKGAVASRAAAFTETDASAQATSDAVGESSSDTNTQESAREKLTESLDSMVQQGGSDGSDSNPFIEELKKAVQTIQLPPEIRIPDQNAWRESVRLMVQKAIIEEKDEPELVRAFDEALAHFQTKEGKRIIEFANLVNKEGAEKALVWLRKQNQDDAMKAGNSSEPAPSSSGTQALGSERKVMRERGRRLRGPPRR